MKKNKKIFILIALLIVVIIVTALNIIRKNFEGMEVQTVAAEIKHVEDSYTETGKIGDVDKSQTISEVRGKILEVPVNLNQRVNKGDVLFIVDSEEYEHQKSQASIAVEGYDAKISKSRTASVLSTTPTQYINMLKEQMDANKKVADNALSDYEASKKLYDGGVISSLELESKKTAYDKAYSAYEQAKNSYDKSNDTFESLKAKGINEKNIDDKFFKSEEEEINSQIKSQRSMIEYLNDKIGKCTVKAQSSGLITDLPVKDISTIQEGQVAAVISSDSEKTGMIEAETDVLTSVAPYIHLGDEVEVNLILRGSEEKYSGKVSEIYDYATQGTSALGLDEYRVHVRILMDEDQDLKGKSGYGVNVKFKVFSSDDKITIPSSAVFKKNGEYFVYVIESGKAKKKKINVIYQSSSDTVIRSGIKEGIEVIDQVDTKGIYEGASVRKAK